MRLMRIGEAGRERPVLEQDGRHLALDGVVTDIGPETWGDDLDRIREAAGAGELPEISIEGERIGSPVRTAGSVLCIGQNYAAHAAEAGAKPPTAPIIFLKTPSTITGPFDPVGLPPGSEKTDWEAELAIVIGQRAAYLPSREAAAEAIGGYLLANDLSERTYQLEISGGQWSKGKCIKDFLPLGPVLVTADEFDPHDVAIRSWVNGETRQDSRTRDMIFDVEEIVRDLSQFMELQPGDIISTGTPEGVALSGRFPFLAEGDVSEVEIEGLGRQRQEYYRVEVRR